MYTETIKTYNAVCNLVDLYTQLSFNSKLSEQGELIYKFRNILMELVKNESANKRDFYKKNLSMQKETAYIIVIIGLHKRRLFEMKHGIELYYSINSKITGEEVKRSYGKFENMDDFYNYIKFIGYNTKDYTFLLSGKDF